LLAQGDDRMIYRWPNGSLPNSFLSSGYNG
jgi:hypothetical protein